MLDIAWNRPTVRSFPGAGRVAVPDLPVFIGEIPDFSVRDGIVHISVMGTETCMALHTFRGTYTRAGMALAEYDHSAVVPLRRSRRPEGG